MSHSAHSGRCFRQGRRTARRKAAQRAKRITAALASFITAQSAEPEVARAVASIIRRRV